MTFCFACLPNITYLMQGCDNEVVLVKIYAKFVTDAQCTSRKLRSGGAISELDHDIFSQVPIYPM